MVMRLKARETIGLASKKAIAMAFATLSLLINTVTAEQALDAGATMREIRVGNVMPYSGPLSSFSSIGRAEAAYFDMINNQGGINGRRLRLISYDDSSDPRIALEHTRNLVERDKVLLIFGSFGTPSNLAVRPYVTGERVPQLFVASGDQTLNAPEAFPWTMGWQPLFRVEGRIYANYFSAYYPGRNIAVLWQNDLFGRDLLEGRKKVYPTEPGRLSPISPSISLTSRSTHRSISCGRRVQIFWCSTARPRWPRSRCDGWPRSTGTQCSS